MRYGTVTRGRFLRRLNRFAALCAVDGAEEVCHVKNTGRLGELLLPGAAAYFVRGGSAARKTNWDLIAVESGGQIVNVDAQAPNRLFAELVAAGRFRPDVRAVKPEFSYGASRLDFRLECENGVELVEVKGVTLLREGRAYFPDAPTERGVKHLRTLVRAAGEGYEAAAVFVLTRKGARALSPNDETHPEFGQALRAAAAAGVQLFAYDCTVSPEEICIDAPVALAL